MALKYLARYTRRVAISSDRIESVTDGRATFRYKDYARGGRCRRMTLSADQFLRRFLLRVLPRGLVRIRSFGFLAGPHPRPVTRVVIHPTPADLLAPL